MAVAGKKGKLYASGTSTAFVAEPCTNTTGNIYQINTSAKRILDPAAALAVKIAGVAQPASALSLINPYFGLFYFVAPPGGAVTIDSSYMPLIQVAAIREVTLEAMATVLDQSKMGDDAHDKTFGLKDAKGEITGLNPLTTVIDGAAGVGHKSFRDWFVSEDPKLLQYDPDGLATDVARTWCIFPKTSDAGSVDQLVTRKISWEGICRELAGLAVKVSPAMWGTP